MQSSVLQVSKWMRFPLLLDTNEWQEFFSLFSNLELYNTAAVIEKEHRIISHQQFVHIYAQYQKQLQSGQLKLKEFRQIFSSSLSVSQEVFHLQEISGNKILQKPLYPVIQMRPYRFNFLQDGKFNEHTISADGISWGIEIAYPQTFLDPKTKRIENAFMHPQCLNGPMFKKVMRWIRKNTMPTKLLFKGKAIQTPLRLGLHAKIWIKQYNMQQTMQVEVLI